MACAGTLSASIGINLFIHIRFQMIPGISSANKKATTATLISMSVFCLSLTAFRCYWSGNVTYLFLVWNLFLAFVPWSLSSILVHRYHNKSRSFSPAPWLILGSWLLFFPNAPYILTDLLHLTQRNRVPFWFDLSLLLSYALTGLMSGLISLLNVDAWLRGRLPSGFVSFLIVAVLFLSGFGIYLGRYQRWNSWDLASNPMALLYDIADRFLNPVSHPRTWAVTLLMGILLNFMFWCIRSLQMEPVVSRK